MLLARAARYSTCPFTCHRSLWQGCSNVFRWEGLSPPPPNLGQKVNQIRGEIPIFTDFGCAYFEHFIPFEPHQLFDKATPMEEPRVSILTSLARAAYHPAYSFTYLFVTDVK